MSKIESAPRVSSPRSRKRKKRLTSWSTMGQCASSKTSCRQSLPCLTGEREGGKRDREGKAYPVRQRTTLWVWVDDKATAKGQ